MDGSNLTSEGFVGGRDVYRDEIRKEKEKGLEKENQQGNLCG